MQEESQQQMITLAVCNKIGLKMEARSFENSLSSIESEGCEILKPIFLYWDGSTWPIMLDVFLVRCATLFICQIYYNIVNPEASFGVQVLG